MAEQVYNSVHTGQQIDEAVSWLQAHAADLICGGAVSGTTIATPDNPTYWFAPQGTYTCGGSTTITISSGNLGIISYNGTEWSSISFYVGAVPVVNDFSGGVNSALSAEMGKLIAGITMTYNAGGTESLALTLEQGPLDSDGKKLTQQETQAWNVRVRSQDYIRVYGAFTLSINSGYYFNAFWYTAEDESTYQGKIGSWPTSYSGNFNGYVRLTIKKGDAGTANVTPSEVEVSMTRTIPAGYVPRIVDVLDSTATDFALSGNMGRKLAEGIFTIRGGSPVSSALSLEQGTILTANGTKAPSSSSTYARRVRTVDFCKVSGEFTISVSDGFLFKMFYYTTADASTFDTTDEWTTSNSFTGNYNGYIMFCVKKSDDTNITPSSVTAQITQNEGGQYVRRIADTLGSTATDMALSANMGKELADGVFMLEGGGDAQTFNFVLEQGGFDSTTKQPTGSSTTYYSKRVRSTTFIQTYGSFSVNVTSGYAYTVYLYPRPDVTAYMGRTEGWVTGTNTFSHVGYVLILIKDATNGENTISPANITATLTQIVPTSYVRRILDSLRSERTDVALSANQGKNIGDALFSSSYQISLLQGGVNADGTRMDTTNSVYGKRVVSAPLKVNGLFSISVSSQCYWNIHFYNEAGDAVTQVWKTAFVDGATLSTYMNEWYGYIRVLFKKDNAGSTACTPSDFSLTLNAHGVSERFQELDNTCVVEFEQGGLTTLGEPNQNAPTTDGFYLKRVRSGFYKVHGEFRISGLGQKIVFLYDENKIWQNRVSDVTSLTWIVNDLVFSHNGYIRIGCRKDDNNSDCTPSDFYITLTNPIKNRIDDIESRLQVIGVPSRSYERSYLGEKIVIQQNKHTFSTYCTLPIGLNQCMAVYDDYIFIFSITTSVASCYLYRLSTMELLATLDLPNSTYKRPHCNAASFSNVYNTSDSIVPLLYVSQWENDGQKCCFVYDFTLNNGTYSVDLIQTILPTNVSTATRGAGQTDWVIDPLGYLYSIGYLIDGGAHIVEGNKTMICRYRLPAISDGAVVTFGDADVLDHFDIPIFNYRQDSIFNNGKILMINGVPQSYGVPCHLLAIDPIAKQIVSDVSLDEFDQEPEGIGVTKDGHLVIGFRNNQVLYRFDFI